MGKSVITLIICLMILVNFTLITIPTSTNAVGGFHSSFKIRLQPGMEIQEAEVGPGDNGIAKFTGVVHCELVADGTYDMVIVKISISSG